MIKTLTLAQTRQNVSSPLAAIFLQPPPLSRTGLSPSLEYGLAISAYAYATKPLATQKHSMSF